jgi:hypothetical protein
MEDAEVKLKMGLHDVEVRAGLAKYPDLFKDATGHAEKFGDHGSESLHKIHHALKGIKELLHGLGVIAVFELVKEYAGELGEFLSEMVFGGEKVRSKWEQIYEAIEKTRKAAESAIEKNKALVYAQLTPEDQITEYEGDRDEAHEDARNARGNFEEYNRFKQMQKDFADGKTFTAPPVHTQEWISFMETQENAMYEAENKEIEAVNKIKKIREDIAKNEADALEERMRREKAFTDQILRGLSQKYAAENKENSQFMPTHEQLVNAGWYSHGRFVSSPNAGMQRDIDGQREQIQQDVAAFGMDDHARSDIKRVNGMQKQLDDILGKKDMSAEMVEQLTEGVAVQQKILGVFLGTIPTK